MKNSDAKEEDEMNRSWNSVDVPIYLIDIQLYELRFVDLR